MIKNIATVFALASLVLFSGCASLKVYEEPLSGARSWVQVANYGPHSIEVFGYKSLRCDETQDLGRLFSVPSEMQNKSVTPRAIRAGVGTTLCFDAYDYEADTFVCRRAYRIEAKESIDYRLNYRADGKGCGVLQIEELPAGHLRK